MHIRQFQLTNKGSLIAVLVSKGLVLVESNKGSERIYYSLTSLGRRVLENECLSVRDYINDLL